MWKTAKTAWHALSVFQTATWLWGLLWAGSAAVIGAIGACLGGLSPPLVILIALGLAVLIYIGYVFYRIHQVSVPRSPQQRADQSPMARWAKDAPGAFEDEFNYLSKKDRGEAVERDTPLGEALAYATLGAWGGTFADAFVAISAGATSHHGDFRQMARDGKITIWGKQRTNEVFDKVPPDHWSKHGVDLAALINGVAKTRWTDIHGSDGEEYHDLMVCRAEIEDWCNGS